MFEPTNPPPATISQGCFAASLERTPVAHLSRSGPGRGHGNLVQPNRAKLLGFEEPSEEGVAPRQSYTPALTL